MPKRCPVAFGITYVSENLDRNADKLSHFFITSENFTRSSPAAGRYRHTRKNAVIFHQAALEPHLNQDKFNIRQALHPLTELGPEFVQLPEDLLPRGLL